MSQGQTKKLTTTMNQQKIDMTTHMKSPSGTGALTLCKAHNAEYFTDAAENVDCENCRLIMLAAPYYYTPNGKNAHYDAGGIETIDVIRAKLTREQFSGYCLGNAIKYTLRANFKGDFSADAEKANDYITWLSTHARESSGLK